MNVKSFFFVATLFAGIFCACSKNEIEEKWAEEEKKLAEWISENKPYLSINSGIYIEKIKPEYSDNIQPEVGDYVLVDFICSFLYDEIVEEVSYKDGQENYEALYPSTFREGGPELWMPERWMSMGIGQLRENEKAYIYVPSRLLGLQDFKTRLYEIHLRKVIDTDLKTYQENLMGCCMKKYHDHVDTITITDNGKDYYVIYHVEKEGSGDAFNAISVKTHTSEYYYMQNDDSRTCFIDRERTGCNDNISKFYQKISEMFSTETRNGKKMKKGGRIIAVMPYKIMYGDKLNKENGQFIAPEHSVLKYEINIDN